MQDFGWAKRSSAVCRYVGRAEYLENTKLRQYQCISCYKQSLLHHEGTTKLKHVLEEIMNKGKATVMRLGKACKKWSCLQKKTQSSLVHYLPFTPVLLYNPVKISYKIARVLQAIIIPEVICHVCEL